MAFFISFSTCNYTEGRNTKAIKLYPHLNWLLCIVTELGYAKQLVIACTDGALKNYRQGGAQF